LTAVTLSVFRQRQKTERTEFAFRAPGHPWTTAAFVAVNWLVVANSFYRYRANALLLLGILLAGIPLYFYWRRRARQDQSAIVTGSI
jgi:APA family basic amino acid/polyamine antiporter